MFHSTNITNNNDNIDNTVKQIRKYAFIGQSVVMYSGIILFFSHYDSYIRNKTRQFRKLSVSALTRIKNDFDLEFKETFWFDIENSLTEELQIGHICDQLSKIQVNQTLDQQFERRKLKFFVDQYGNQDDYKNNIKHLIYGFIKDYNVTYRDIKFNEKLKEQSEYNQNIFTELMEELMFSSLQSKTEGNMNLESFVDYNDTLKSIQERHSLNNGTTTNIVIPNFDLYPDILDEELSNNNANSNANYPVNNYVIDKIDENQDFENQINLQNINQRHDYSYALFSKHPVVEYIQNGEITQISFESLISTANYNMDEFYIYIANMNSKELQVKSDMIKLIISEYLFDTQKKLTIMCMAEYESPNYFNYLYYYPNILSISKSDYNQRNQMVKYYKHLWNSYNAVEGNYVDYFFIKVDTIKKSTEFINIDRFFNNPNEFYAMDKSHSLHSKFNEISSVYSNYISKQNRIKQQENDILKQKEIKRLEEQLYLIRAEKEMKKQQEIQQLEQKIKEIQKQKDIENKKQEELRLINLKKQQQNNEVQINDLELDNLIDSVLFKNYTPDKEDKMKIILNYTKYKNSEYLNDPVLSVKVTQLIDKLVSKQDTVSKTKNTCLVKRINEDNESDYLFLVQNISSQTQNKYYVDKHYILPKNENPKFLKEYKIDCFDNTSSTMIANFGQGYLGDCYLLASMSSLIKLKYNLKQNFVYINEEKGCYIVKFNRGKDYYIVVDSQIPMEPYSNSTKPVPVYAKFNKSLKNKLESFPCLIEKAYSKLYGGYDKLTGGHPDTCMSEITGGCNQIVDLCEETSDSLWMKLEEYCSKPISICIASKSKGKVSASQWEGIVSGHAYSLFRVAAVQVGAKAFRLVQLRNPHGHKEFTGEFSDSSKLMTPQVRSQLNYHDNSDDGVFWIPIEKILKLFDTLYLCKFLSFDMVYRTFRSEWKDGSAGSYRNMEKNPQFRLTIKKRCKVIIKLSVIYGKDDKADGTFNIERKGLYAINFGIYKNDGQKLTKNKNSFVNDSTYEYKYILSRELDLDPYAYTIVASTYESNQYTQFDLTVYNEREQDLILEMFE